MSIIDDYMRIRDLKQDGLGLREAFDIIKNNIADKGLGFMRGQHMFDTPIKTKRAGTLYSNEDLQSAYNAVRNNPDAITASMWKQMPTEDTSHLPPTSSILPSGPVHEPLIPRDVWESQPALQGSVLGATAQPNNAVSSLSQLQGREPIPDITIGDDVINTYLKNATKWAGTPHQSPNLIYRKADTVAENVPYVEEYLDTVLRYAPYYDLPPKTLAAMLMYESGWGGERFDGNLGGYGFISTPEGGVHDMGFRFDAPTPREQALNFMDHLSGTRYAGSRNVEDFVSRGYNSANPNYSKMVNSILGMLEAQ